MRSSTSAEPTTCAPRVGQRLQLAAGHVKLHAFHCVYSLYNYTGKLRSTQRHCVTSSARISGQAAEACKVMLPPALDKQLCQQMFMWLGSIQMLAGKVCRSELSCCGSILGSVLFEEAVLLGCTVRRC